MSSKVKYWKPGSWSEQRNVKQIPNYDDPEGLGTVKEKIRNSLPLVKYDEVVNLRNILKNIENGGGFFVQLGDCAESLSDFSETKLESYFKLFSEVQNILFSFLNKNVTIIGRMAGQFAKPRSELYEIINDELVITYRGDIINSTERTKKARSPDPLRMLWAYEQSFRTLELSKNFFRDGDFFSSHEALLLHYEESLVRKYKGRNVLTSTHLPWLGYRTCEIDGAHVEFLRGII
ncbi:MAG: 3-deoxy-7-phosphoheptulonate synthase, partial [Rickettsiales bacterium]|nr:3-deoxy-7-phosphoheptulonate synthase [Rickettsiales bacterium]